MQNWKINEEIIDKMISDSKQEIFEPEYGSAVTVRLTLPNGYTIAETSGCINPKQYDRDLGIANCMDKLKVKLWELEGYHRKYLYNEYEESHKKESK